MVNIVLCLSKLGEVLHEVSRLISIEHIAICKIDGMGINVSKRYFLEIVVGFDDPRVRVSVGNGSRL
jgi:spermidine synthase